MTTITTVEYTPSPVTLVAAKPKILTLDRLKNLDNWR